MSQDKLNAHFPNPEASFMPEGSMLEVQRSGLGLLNLMMFPAIAFAALVYAASQLVT